MSYKDILAAAFHPIAIVCPLQLVHAFQFLHVGWYSVGTVQVVGKVFVILVYIVVQLVEGFLCIVELLLQACRLIGDGIILAAQALHLVLVAQRLGLLNLLY